MSIIALIILTLFAAACIAFLNRGTMDKEFKRREAHWSKYEHK